VLVSRGANLINTARNGSTPLIGAVVNGRVEMVGYLLRIKAVGATIDAQDHQGRTAYGLLLTGVMWRWLSC